MCISFYSYVLSLTLCSYVLWDSKAGFVLSLIVLFPPKIKAFDQVTYDALNEEALIQSLPTSNKLEAVDVHRP